ncbi:MAG TPA: hypothetical protein VFL99_11825 [Segeticoccus sp.]|uniref:hypothetical protein n=1 Tax=Segeticoccus sp. TaxID=2706531 RepID=UPI002D80B3FD|nr:hypothetical protein [Segeticoccus sp.]HET8601006.1 hypothetical protein [Segeticoccus sp.]
MDSPHTVPLAAGSGSFIHWGVLNVSVANLVVIAVMVLLFLLAIALPFPHAAVDTEPLPEGPEHGSES